ncbi:MAG: hypothetical protein D6758_00830 [Gammaproteobacteria bacterium]|nr:MAG: hypothetical protein D6758_00830 [Gammaproteobacteria bacterium]
MQLAEGVRSSLFLCLMALVVLSGCTTSPEKRIEYGAVTSHPLATQAALRILDNGGTAADAAVAASAVLSVVRPDTAPMGGGQLWLIAPPDQPPYYLDALPELPDDLFSALPKSVQPAIPGTWAGWDALTAAHGQLPRTTLYSDALKLAEKGVPGEGARPALARFFKALRIRGRAGVYEGPFAQALSQAVIAAGGYWQADELKSYRVQRHAARQVRTEEGGDGIWYTPPPAASRAGVDLATTAVLMQATPETLPLSTRLALVTHLQADVWPDSPLNSMLHASLPVSREYLAPHLEELDDWLEAPPPRPERAPPGAGNCRRTAAGLVVQDRQGLRVAAVYWTPGRTHQAVDTGSLGLTLFDTSTDASPLLDWLSRNTHLPTHNAPLIRESASGSALIAVSHPQSVGILLWTLEHAWTTNQPMRLWQSRSPLCTVSGRWLQARPPVQALSAQLAPVGLGVVAAPVRSELDALVQHERKLRLQPLTESARDQGRAITRILDR